MAHEQPQEGKPIEGHIDVSSLPDHPDHIGRADFAQQFVESTNITHGEEPEERVVDYNGVAANEDKQARAARSMAVNGGIGIAFSLIGQEIVHTMQGKFSGNGEAIRAVAEHHITPLTMVLGGLLMVISTTGAEIHHGRAERARAAFDEMLRTAEPDEA